ncbi:hypothetical protein [Marinovum algicola]|uniref:hypothetical protein n=1 Tax=Marinovum algicola TaxID=42444 RepID=UPI00352B23D8
MSYLIEIDGQEVTVPVSVRGGVVHCMVRAADQATFEAMALKAGLIDEDGRPAPGVDIARLGPHVIKAATFDVLGKELTAAEVDDRFHANFWLGPEVAERGLWLAWARRWLRSGRALTALEVNRGELGVVHEGIELIDPDSVAAPANILL